MPGWMKWTVALLIGFGIVALGFRFAGWLLTGFFVLNCMVLIIVVLLAKRQSRRPRRRLRWRRQPDRLRPARRSQRIVQGHHLVRSNVHALRPGHGPAHRSRRRSGRLRPPKSFATRQARAQNTGAHARLKSPTDYSSPSHATTHNSAAASHSRARPQETLSGIRPCLMVKGECLNDRNVLGECLKSHTI